MQRLCQIFKILTTELHLGVSLKHLALHIFVVIHYPDISLTVGFKVKLSDSYSEVIILNENQGEVK